MVRLTITDKAKKRAMACSFDPGELIESGGKCLMILDRVCSHPTIYGVPKVPAVCLSDATLTFLETTCPAYPVYAISMSCVKKVIKYMRLEEEEEEEEEEAEEMDDDEA